MWTFLLVFVAVIVWPASAQGQVYLTTVGNWRFYKVQVSGPMFNQNIRSTCLAKGMELPCYQSGKYAGCTTYWTSGCITYDSAGGDCRAHWVLSAILCGDTDSRYCQPLDDTFVYMPGYWSDDSAWGVDFETHSYQLQGANYYNMFALCATQDRDIDECLSSPCVHGTCTDGVASYTCSCENGWTGNNCDQNIDDCASSPCVHGTCTDGVASYTCSCENGWTGNNCDQVSFSGQCYQFSSTALSHQDSALACSANGGRLVDVMDHEQQSFLADKMAASSGNSNWLAMKTAPTEILNSDGSPISGQLEWSSREPAEPCDLCVLLDSSDNYLAKTAPCAEQHNYVCQDAQVSCAPNVCQNGGNCTSCFNGSATFCRCPDGFDGRACEVNIDECASNPCHNNGTCQDGINSYSCRCPTGFHGDHCEFEMDWCSQAQCPLGWTCQDFNFYFLCLHPTPVTREFPYQCSSASCPAGMYCTEEGVASFSCKAV